MIDGGFHSANLPGVRRHVRAVRDDLRDGKSCLWVLPESMLAPARFRELEALLARDLPVVRVDAPTTASAIPTPRLDQVPARPRTLDLLLESVFQDVPVPTVLTASTDSPSLGNRLADTAARFVHDHGSEAVTTAQGSDDALVRVVEHRPAGGLVLLVPSDVETDREALVSTIQRYPALARARNGPDASPVLLVVGSHRSLGTAVSVDALTTRVHWWWGVYTRLDLLTIANESVATRHTANRLALDSWCPDLVPECIAEVAGPNVELAVHLAARWDGTRKGMHAEIREWSDRNGPTHADGRESDEDGRSAGARPSQRLLDAWHDGAVGAWDGHLRWTPADPGVSVPARILDRLWIGQARALQPHLDRLRGLLNALAIRSLDTEARTRLRRCYGEGCEIDALELNALRRAVRERAAHLGNAARSLLDETAAARNQLAHRHCVDDHRLVRLRELDRQVRGELPR